MPKSPDQKPVLFYLYWALAGGLETPFFLVLFSPHNHYLANHFSLSLAMHALATVTVFFSLPKGVDWFHHERCWPKTFILWVGFLPALGWILCGALYLFYRQPKNPDEIFKEDDGEKFDPVRERLFFVEQSAVEHDVKVTQGLDFLPLADILAGNDTNLKRGAVENLCRLGNYESINLLLAYRNAADPEVRFYVTTALTRIKKELDEELDAAKRQMQKDVYKISSRVFLAKIYWRYARSHLLDVATSRRYVEESVHHLAYVLESGFAREEVYWLLFEIHFEDQNWEACLQDIQKLASQGKGDVTRIFQVKARLYFRMGKYEELLLLINKPDPAINLDAEWQSLMMAWQENLT